MILFSNVRSSTHGPSTNVTPSYITFICILCDIAKFLILNVIVVFLSWPVLFSSHDMTGTIILELLWKLVEFNVNLGSVNVKFKGFLINSTLHHLSPLFVNEKLKLVGS